MASRTVQRRGIEAKDPLQWDLLRWKRLVQDLPQVRIDKVMATRDALRRNHYDEEQVIIETVVRLSNDVGILCRQ